MTTEFVESGMTFGQFPEGYCFRIEKSVTYKKVQKGVKIAEFVLLRRKEKPAVWIVEAKSSGPNPKTQPNFNDFINEVREKLSNTLSLVLACCLKRHSSAVSELPEPFKELNLSSLGFCFILVVKKHDERWLPPLHRELSKALNPMLKTWAVPANAVVVLNENMARLKGLIL